MNRINIELLVKKIVLKAYIFQAIKNSLNPLLETIDEDVIVMVIEQELNAYDKDDMDAVLEAAFELGKVELTHLIRDVSDEIEKGLPQH